MDNGQFPLLKVAKTFHFPLSTFHVSITTTASATGKIILSGEYAVLFGKRGIAIPSEKKIKAMFTASQKNNNTTIEWSGKSDDDTWMIYAKQIAEKIKEYTGVFGTFHIENDLSLGKGMGASTALILAMCRASLGPDCARITLTIENELNPGNSGIDFAVIWEGKPILFQKNSIPEIVDIDLRKLGAYELIDTGAPNETTPELVAWVRSREAELKYPIETIGNCTERLLQGEDIHLVLRDHHRAQVALGIVPISVQRMITEIEERGGSAKVIGAGARTGGGGMVLALP